MTVPSFDELKTIDLDVDNNVEIALDHAGRTVVKITLPDYSTVKIRASEILATMAPLQYERALDRWYDDRARDTARQCSPHGESQQCTQHGGAFDCTPFCHECKGEQ